MSDSQRIGELGTKIVEKIILKELRWTFRRVHQEHDFGIDGYIDLVASNGDVTGKSFAVQIKSGKTYHDNADDLGIMYVGEFRHLNLFLNGPTPVLLIVCDEESEVAWWRLFEKDEIVPSDSNWKLLIPLSQTLDAAQKHKLETLAGPTQDYVETLREEWDVRDRVRKMDKILIVSREEIRRKDTTNVAKFLRDLSSSSLEAVMAAQGKVHLSIDGYNNSTKELCEFEEVRRWMKKLEREVKTLFWFLTFSLPHQSLFAVMFCVCDSKVIFRDFSTRKAMIYTPVRKKLAFVVRNFQRLNDFTDSVGIPSSENHRVSCEIGDCMKKLGEEAKEARANLR